MLWCDQGSILITQHGERLEHSLLSSLKVQKITVSFSSQSTCNKGVWLSWKQDHQIRHLQRVAEFRLGEGRATVAPPSLLLIDANHHWNAKAEGASFLYFLIFFLIRFLFFGLCIISCIYSFLVRDDIRHRYVTHHDPQCTKMTKNKQVGQYVQSLECSVESCARCWELQGRGQCALAGRILSMSDIWDGCLGGWMGFARWTNRKRRHFKQRN